jgi:chemotaxis methyl-accepting protein methylase
MTDLRSLTPDAIDRITLDTEPWLSCDDCFDHLDTVVETVLTRTGSMTELFRVHLAGCSVCREEAMSLATLVAADHALDPARATALMESALAGEAERTGPSDR